MTSMEIYKIMIQLAIGMGVLSVWVLRFSKVSRYKQVGVSSSIEEPRIYGFPKSVMLLIGVLKVLFSVGLIIGIFYSALIRPSAIGLAVMMLGTMIVKFREYQDASRIFPSFLMLAFCLLILLL